MKLCLPSPRGWSTRGTSYEGRTSVNHGSETDIGDVRYRNIVIVQWGKSDSVRTMCLSVLTFGKVGSDHPV